MSGNLGHAYQAAVVDIQAGSRRTYVKAQAGKRIPRRVHTLVVDNYIAYTRGAGGGEYNPLRRTALQSAAVVGNYSVSIHCARGEAGHLKRCGAAGFFRSNTGVVV